ncbi:hypothetical protein LCGC14_0677040 [marine sediment metagenome]|uniref:Uncharacterized protein n=1 Tax=marine sediment metagenome TaxID=412755 RepID=A0A0F9QP87_9ZZZZ
MTISPPVLDTKEFKRNLMGEFNALYMKTTDPQNMSSIQQVSEEIIEVGLQQYPDQGETYEVRIFDELNRLRHFGWQLRYIKYEADSTLFLYFQKVDRRNVDFYNLVHDEHNNEQDLWWLKNDKV